MPSKVTTTTPNDGIEISAKHNPIMWARMLYAAFVQGLFAAAPVGAYHWEEGENTEILITDENPVDSEIVGTRPAVTFTRSAIKFHSLGIGDLFYMDMRTGRKTKGALVPGIMSINCCSRSGLEAEQIAWIISEHLWLLREQLMGTNKFFEIGRQSQISPITGAEGLIANDAGKEWYAVTVSTAFQIPRMSRFTPQNLSVVQAMEANISTRFKQIISRGWHQQGHEPVSANIQNDFPAAFSSASNARGGSFTVGSHTLSPPKKIPHPLNPAVSTLVAFPYPNQHGLRPARIGGRPIPITQASVEQSGTITTSTKVKV